MDVFGKETSVEFDSELFLSNNLGNRLIRPQSYLFLAIISDISISATKHFTSQLMALKKHIFSFSFVAL